MADTVLDILGSCGARALSESHPSVIEEVQWFRIKRGYIRAVDIIDTDPRRLEKSYHLFRPKSAYTSWLHAARDRQVWDVLLNFWIAHWIGLGPTLIDCSHFLGKQLVAVDTLWASLRPARAPPFDIPYPSAFQHIRPIHKDFWKRKGLIFILNRHLDWDLSSSGFVGA